MMKLITEKSEIDSSNDDLVQDTDVFFRNCHKIEKDVYYSRLPSMMAFYKSDLTGKYTCEAHDLKKEGTSNQSVEEGKVTFVHFACSQIPIGVHVIKLPKTIEEL